ncbi:FG-GAP-like repeat-containing protein [Streptomyces sp. CB01201]|uniref:FG-GAP-like repeat-containing protein n=1 Tax=Streptomyces sp. CB01201 TaxID=2020324 RepID=UPI00131D1732|nr:FG-GAP-like repeat-containing protein [Streptomyces sp. CB01201]
MSEEGYALQQAKSTGNPYELVSARTEATDTWAQPDGTFTVRQYGQAVRVWRAGAWVATDPTLVFAADGSVVPKASTVPVKFSGGGTGPMLSGVKDGRTLSLSWPKVLPKPTLSDNIATYSEVLPGVDLQLKAEVEGFSQLLVVKSAQAAQNPELATLNFATSTVGLDVHKDGDTGTLVATDPAGQTVFTSPAPMMWDSTPQPADAGAAPAAKSAKRALAASEDASTPTSGFEPGGGAKDAVMETALTSNSLSITPDQKLLTGADTTYPVYIDPTWGWGDRQKWSWTRVYAKYPNNSYWNANEDVRVGYESETNGLSRSYFRLDTSYVSGAQIQSATFRIRNTWSWSCTKADVVLGRFGDISPKTTWNNQPSQIGGDLATVHDAKGWSSTVPGCAAGNLEFNATSALRDSVAAGQNSLTLGLKVRADDERNHNAWKRFDPKTAVLEVQYNHLPEKPDKPGTSPQTSCTAGGVIGNTPISVYAHVKDQDSGNLTAHFQVFKSGSTQPVVDTSVPALNDRIVTLVLPGNATPSGVYTWKVQTTDEDHATSKWSDTCTFTTDRDRPSHPPTITSTVFPNGDQGWPDEPNGDVNDNGHFTFGPNGVTDVASYNWWTDYDPQVNRADPGAPFTDEIKPPVVGPHMVYAYSVDKAGNRSDTATYLYYADGTTLRDGAGDLNGDGFKDIWSVDSNGTLLTYAGHGNKEFSVATNGGGAFPGQQVTAGGDWGQDGKNDLISLEYNDTAQQNLLKVYPNNGRGVINRDGYTFFDLKVTCPKPTAGGLCKGITDDHWSNADQILTGDFNGDSKPDILVKQGKQLWAYYGDRSDYLTRGRSHPVLVGGSDWDQFTLISPGDINNDGLPDLLMRKDDTGDMYRTYGEADPNGALNAATFGTAPRRTKLAGLTLKKADYPTIGSSGDFDGDDVTDLWGRKTDNTVTGWPGQATGGNLTGFGQPFTIDGSVGGRRITPGTRLTSGQSVTSNSAKLTMQADGNLVITSNANKVIWSANTGGNPGATALVQSDGNITVNKAGDDSTSLWSTNQATTGKPEHLADGYVMLQDRGNLIIDNAKGQALWSSGSAIRHDYNGDGRSDMASWYTYSDGHAAFQSFLTNSDGTFNAPFGSYSSGTGSWNVNKMRFATGDYNGDGRGDAAMTYDYGGGLMKVFTAFGKPDGGFQAPVVSYTSAKGSWYSESMSLQSGDFNGDGRDDLAIWYSYADGSDRLFTLTADVRGGFNPPFEGTALPAGWWDVKQSKVVTGDFNGDGRDDIAALYGYGDGTLKMHTFLAGPTGAFQPDLTSWGSTITSWGDWNRTYLQAGDFNGDGIDDIITWYDYSDGSDAMHTLVATSTRDGKFNAPTQAWKSAPGNWDHNHMMITTGDYNGDGRDDVGAMYGYSDGTSRMYTWTTKPDGTLNGAAPGYSFTTPANWNYAANTVLRPYN